MSCTVGLFVTIDVDVLDVRVDMCSLAMLAMLNGSALGCQALMAVLRQNKLRAADSKKFMSEACDCAYDRHILRLHSRSILLYL